MTITLRSVYSLSTTAPSRVMSDEPTLVCQKVGIQEKAGIKYPTMATNLQPAELRTAGLTFLGMGSQLDR